MWREEIYIDHVSYFSWETSVYSFCEGVEAGFLCD